MTTISLLIGGERRQAAKGAMFERRNPLDGSVAPLRQRPPRSRLGHEWARAPVVRCC